jgi:TrpR-related protein YerC/YecD
VKPNRNQSDIQRKRAENSLFRAVTSLETTAECRDFFKDLCTPAELQALADRWHVVELLLENLPYRQIHDKTGVSVTTIGRVARFLSDGFGGYRTALERSSRKHAPSKTGASQ